MGAKKLWHRLKTILPSAVAQCRAELTTGLAITVTAAAAEGSAVSEITTIPVKGPMKMMKSWKVKFVAGAGAAALLAGGTATWAGAQTGGGGNLTAQEIAGKSRDAYAALSSYRDDGTVVSEMSGQTNTLTFNTRLQRPNLYRIEWSHGAGLRVYGSENGVVWSDGSGDYLLTAAAGQEKDAQSKKMQNMKRALAQATGQSWSAASTIAGAFFAQDLGDVFIAPVASGRYPLQKEKDAKVGDVDCYVVSSVLDLSKMPETGKSGTASTTLWIGRSDFLIHQTRTKYVEKVDSSAQMTDQAIDDAIRKSLELQNKAATPEAIAAMRPQMKEVMKQVQSTLKSGFEAGVVTTQTHNNIVVNEKLSPADFTR
jgi:outer membrane lipoprotein-sorting protein